MKLSTKVKGWFGNSDEKKANENKVEYEEQNEKYEDDDGSPVPDMLRLEG